LGESATRQRLAAILAADAAGYSRLMGADEHATVAALDAGRTVFRRHIEANRGRLVDTAGDSVLAVFETANGAVAASLAIQQEIAGALRFRIGVHLGDVIEKADGTVYGNGVNIAARLQALAEPGGIVISDAVRGSVKQQVTDLGAQTVKNIAEPVHAYAIGKVGVRGLRKSWAAPVFAAAAVVAAVGAWYALKGGTPPAVEGKSIAVLPFANMSDDKDTAYFADGVHEDLLTQLALLGDVKVVSRTSVMDYRNTKKNSRQIGSELGVVSLVEGSVRRAGNQIRVTAQLIDAKSDKHLWAKSYDRELKDVFAIQSELATEIAKSLKVSLDPQDSARLAQAPTDNLEAYDFYLRVLESKRQTIGSIRLYGTLRDRIAMLDKAVALDPKFALAWAMLASENARAYSWSIDRTPERLALAKAAFERAQALKPDDLQVKIEAGNYYRHALSDYARAGKLYEEVLLVAPNNIDALMTLATVRRTDMHRGEEIALLERAVAIDPRNAQALDFLYSEYADFRHYDRAIALLRQLIDIRRDDDDLKARLSQLEYWRTGSWQAYDEWRSTLPAGAAKSLGGVHYLDTQRALSRREFDRALNLVTVEPEDLKGANDPRERAGFERYYRALLLHAKGDRKEAAKTAQAALRLVERELARTPDDPGKLTAKARLLAMTGARASAFSTLEGLVALYTRRGNASLAEVMQRETLQLHALLGERKEALAETARQLKRPGTYPHNLRVDPALASLWDDKEFLAVVNHPASNAQISFDAK
jgi:adenylate cyclase